MERIVKLHEFRKFNRDVHLDSYMRNYMGFVVKLVKRVRARGRYNG